MAFEVLGAPRRGSRVAPALDALTEVVAVQRPDLIVLADDQNSSAALDRLLDIADGRFRVAGLTSFYEYALGCVPLHQITPMWFMSLLHVRQRPYACWVKRAFDLITAGLALLVTAPLLPLIALAVRGTPGPIIYRQTRVGDGGRRFKIYKFRTMVDGAERPGEAVWAKDADPRTTPGGAFLRRTHLDELPQLFNVLKGDMSMVGPRPERPELIAMLEENIPYWSRRLLIKPGMTGWAQVHCGYAADFPAATKLAYDFWYLRHRSLAVDLAICVRTLRPSWNPRAGPCGATQASRRTTTRRAVKVAVLSLLPPPHAGSCCCSPGKAIRPRRRPGPPAAPAGPSGAAGPLPRAPRRDPRLDVATAPRRAREGRRRHRARRRHIREPPAVPDPHGHRIYAARRGRAVLRAGVSLGGNTGRPGALVRGVVVDIDDARRTVDGAAIAVWGTGRDVRILDTTLRGNGVTRAGISAQQPEGLEIRRVVVRRFTDFGIFVDANDLRPGPALQPVPHP